MKPLVRRTRTVIGTRDFAVSAATSWNSLPAALRLLLLLLDVNVQTSINWRLQYCLPSQFRHLHGNWKLSTSARLCNANEDHLFCALQMQKNIIIIFSTKWWKTARKSVSGRPRFFGAFVQVLTRGTAQQRKVEFVSFARWRYFIIHVTITTSATDYISQKFRLIQSDTDPYQHAVTKANRPGRYREWRTQDDANSGVHRAAGQWRIQNEHKPRESQHGGARLTHCQTKTTLIF